MRPLLKPAPDGSMIESLFTPWLQEDPDVSPRVRQKCTLSMRTRYIVVPLLRIVPYANLVKATQRLPHTLSISRYPALLTDIYISETFDREIKHRYRKPPTPQGPRRFAHSGILPQ